ncbi:TPA: lysozyme inhibitor LprI family protein [Klebsiella michiganensis]
MKIREVLMTIAVLYPIAGYSASFDCQKATQVDEKAICANRSLNDMDVVMATKYQFLRGLFPMGTRGEMMDAQKTWLHSRQKCGSDSRCLTKSYEDRLQQLDEIYAGIDKPL